MRSFSCAACVVLCIAATAHAGAVLQVDALTPPDQPGGMYSPGAVVDFGVSISTDVAQDINVRGIGLDFQASSPELIFQGPGGSPDFAFDFSTAGGGAMYAAFPAYMKPAATYIGVSGPLPGQTLVIPTGGTLALGTGQVQLPLAGGTYTVDALNAVGAGAGNGGVLTTFFANPTEWTPGNGHLTGVPALLHVVPEPATVGLLAIGAVMCARRRRRSRR